MACFTKQLFIIWFDPQWLTWKLPNSLVRLNVLRFSCCISTTLPLATRCWIYCCLPFPAEITRQWRLESAQQWNRFTRWAHDSWCGRFMASGSVHTTVWLNVTITTTAGLCFISHRGTTGTRVSHSEYFSNSCAAHRDYSGKFPIILKYSRLHHYSKIMLAY